MAFSFPSKNAFMNRYNSLPETIRDVVDSTQTKKILENISAEHRLDESKNQTLGALITFVLMGFLAKSEITHEISEQLFLNHEHSRELANEISARILDSVKEELEEIYNPYGDETEVEGEEQEESEVPISEPIEPLTETSGEKIQVSAIGSEDVSEVSVPISEDAGPMVIQKSASFFEKPVERTTQKKPLSMFSMFTSSSESAETKPAVKVKIESSHTFGWPFEKPEKKAEDKVVHYSEAHTSISPALSQSTDGLINIGAIHDAPPPEPSFLTPSPTPSQEQHITVPIKTGPIPEFSKPFPSQEIPTKTQEDGSPTLEGNVVHLR